MTLSSGETRRRFLRMLAASPLLASSSPLLAANRNIFRYLRALDEGSPAAITEAGQALDVMDFEPLARKALPPAHFGYIATGVDDDASIQANRDGFQKIQIRSRRLVNVEKVDTSVRVFGATWPTPIFLCPVSSMKAFHPDGEVAVARAAKTKNHLQILSTVATSSIEEVTAARGAAVWQQLYPTNVWEVTRGIMKRAEAAGSPVLVLTVDLQNDSNRETQVRAERVDTRDCSNCHDRSSFKGYVSRKPAFDKLDVSKVTGLHLTSMNWDFVKRLKDSTSMKLVVKGIVTREDAQLAVEHGVDGIIISNHGGRAEGTLRSTIECLPEVVQGAGGKIPVMIDSGFRRGTDVFKALALGATAVGVGRPQAWGLAAFGEQGVEAVLTILQREIEAMMRQAGTPSVAAITRSFVVENAR
jgi:isopentenyl diphosphate isomerase/L-lactate dehydrogenase-like FMN-dependent dehydrogenase